MKKPTPDEFELTSEFIIHKPTGHRFVSIAGTPGKGVLEPGYEAQAAEYDTAGVHKMAVRLWGRHLAKSA